MNGTLWQWLNSLASTCCQKQLQVPSPQPYDLVLFVHRGSHEIPSMQCIIEKKPMAMRISIQRERQLT